MYNSVVYIYKLKIWINICASMFYILITYERVKEYVSDSYKIGTSYYKKVFLYVLRGLVNGLSLLPTNHANYTL